MTSGASAPSLAYLTMNTAACFARLSSAPMTAKPRAYLNHAATTPMKAEAIDAMLPYLSEVFANPSAARHAPPARPVVHSTDEMIFVVISESTAVRSSPSAGTEADNLAVHGIGGSSWAGVIVSAVEHHALLRPAALVGAKLIAVDGQGRG